MSVSLDQPAAPIVRLVPPEWYETDDDAEWELLLLERSYDQLQAELTDLVHIAEATDRAIKRGRRVGLVRQRDALDRTIQQRVAQVVDVEQALRHAHVERLVPAVVA